MRLTASLIILLTASGASAQPQAVLYGTLTLDDDKTVSGALRWNNRAQYWIHHMRGDYAEPFDLETVSEDVADAIVEHQPGPQLHLNDDVVIEFVKWFSDEELQEAEWKFPFGAVDSVELLDDHAEVTLTGGHQFRARKSGSLSGSIEIRSQGGEIRDYEMSDIRRIELSEAPEDAHVFPDLLFGTIHADGGTFSGLIEWDQDEIGVTEELDGDLPDGDDLSIEFGDIARIEKIDDDASRVYLKNDKSHVLDNSNDVDNENRGNVVHDLSARRTFDWARFAAVDFQPVPQDWLPKRSDFANHVLRGTVHFDDQSAGGNLYLDLAHQLTTAVASVEDNGLRVQAPLGGVRAVVRDNGRFSLKLNDGSAVKGGASLFAGPSSGGVLIRTGDTQKFVPWSKVSRIELERAAR